MSFTTAPGLAAMGVISFDAKPTLVVPLSDAPGTNASIAKLACVALKQVCGLPLSMVTASKADERQSKGWCARTHANARLVIGW